MPGAFSLGPSDAMRFLIEIILCLHLVLMPVAAFAQTVAPKDPLSYPLKTYGFMLAMAIFGGFVSWYAKVRRQEIPAGSVFHLIGEITTSAFAGMLTFFACEYLNSPQLLTAALVGVSGHMGAKVITMLEDAAKKRAEERLGLAPHDDAAGSAADDVKGAAQ